MFSYTFCFSHEDYDNKADRNIVTPEEMPVIDVKMNMIAKTNPF